MQKQTVFTNLTSHLVEHLRLICVRKTHVRDGVAIIQAIDLGHSEVDSTLNKLALLPCHILAILIASPNLKSIEIVKIFI